MVDKGNTLTATSPTTVAVADNVKHTVRRRLLTAPAYAFTFERIAIHYADGILTLRGQLPSFYLKQLLQTLLRDVEGVAQINNQVDVKGPGRHQVEAAAGTRLAESSPWR